MCLLLLQGPHLVVVPLSVLPSWLSEFQRWSPQVTGKGRSRSGSYHCMAVALRLLWVMGTPSMPSACVLFNYGSARQAIA